MTFSINMSQMLFTCNSNGQNVLYFYLLNLAVLALKHHKLPHEEPGLPGDMEFVPQTTSSQVLRNFS